MNAKGYVALPRKGLKKVLREFACGETKKGWVEVGRLVSLV
jgi:hypothetical protein